MKKHNTSDKIISLLLGAVIAIPICISARSEWESKPAETVVKKSVETCSDPFPSAGIERVFEEMSEDYEKVENNERVLMGEYVVTAYCPCENCCPGTSDGITYTETIATEGRTIAVDPDVISLGSIVEVNGENYVAEDTGGAIKGKHIELYFDNHEDALQWGKQLVPVYMIEECIGEF